MIQQPTQSWLSSGYCLGVRWLRRWWHGGWLRHRVRGVFHSHRSRSGEVGSPSCHSSCSGEPCRLKCARGGSASWPKSCWVEPTGAIWLARIRQIRIEGKYHLLAVELKVVLRWHDVGLGFIRVWRINTLSHVGKNLLGPKHAIGIETGAVVHAIRRGRGTTIGSWATDSIVSITDAS